MHFLDANVQPVVASPTGTKQSLLHGLALKRLRAPAAVIPQLWRQAPIASLLVLVLALSGCAVGPQQAASAITSTRSIATVTSHPTVTAPVAAEVRKSAVETGEAFSGQRALQDVRWLAQTIGIRPAGSDAEQRAAEGLAIRLKEAGYQVEMQPFTIERLEDRGSSLRLTSGSNLSVTVQAMNNSGSGAVSGALLDAGLGRTTDTAGQHLRGAIALIRRGEISFGEKVRNAVRAGAVGVVIYNNKPGLFRGTLAYEADVPVAAMSQEDGQRLAQQIAAGRVSVELSVDMRAIEAASRNVVATLRGAQDATIVLGAHYDSVPDGPGANDNASGAATAVELARALKAVGTPFTIRIVLFGAEEIGLVGSREYVTALSAADRERVAAMLNFDMVGVGDQPQIGGNDDLVEQVQQLAAAQGARVTQFSEPNSSSDHASFIEAGMPAVFFYRAEDVNYHSAEDQARYVEAGNLEFAGRLALSLITQLAAQLR